MSIDSLNQTLYEKSSTVKEYICTQKELWIEEKTIFEKYEQHIKDKAILDVGCGGGRTAIALSELTSNYTGIDYSIEMVKACQKWHSSLNFLHVDASDMYMFDGESFDFIIFSFNGIDCMSYEKRIKTLKEIYRVLKKNGIFAFSSHNLDDRKIVIAFNKYDMKRPRAIVRNFLNIMSYLKVRKYQIHTDTYEILSDPLAGFGHLTYYIRKQEQVKQLVNIGFKNIAILNRQAQFVDINSLDRDSEWLHYVCQKPTSNDRNEDSQQK
ncbi:class I SAM-dependent methyltransferase [Chroococcidiopsis sp. FACHB-1243]|uniref:class I SAM-dependent methyltransferase n=1 Tax=Chroococcidiopsis sp. [FACHB-1243] TaxID=2692781 RepID=UPI00177D1B1C|nr:class I SAM-dependent methyltransferase [Chroococcidiopsis sp. [FACHB-1243]]MBD2308327.1 class I SAM-dependent methyltransferase [Chroococcidiopsis sp. [FACHB-1243]]